MADGVHQMGESVHQREGLTEKLEDEVREKRERGER
jgi:hypothetical protein